MKKIFVLAVAFILMASAVWGAGTSSQVTCNGTAAVIYAGTSSAIDVKNLAVTFTVLTAGVTVYISPMSTVTTSTAGIALSTTGIAGYIVEGKSSAWYCITSGDSATVGVSVVY